MVDRSRTGLHDFTRASRKAEEAAWRRFQAVEWLECLVGPLVIPNQPSEKEFISCVRNGLILCNAINKIQPGAVPRVLPKNEKKLEEVKVGGQDGDHVEVKAIDEGGGHFKMEDCNL